MTRVTWLPLGHVSHGYRRVFILQDKGHEDENPSTRILVLTPMAYEAVYEVKEAVNDDRVTDPSLFWGLSLIRRGLLDDSWLFGDDGFLSTRPQSLTNSNEFVIDEFVKASQTGWWLFDGSNRRPKA